MSAGPTTLPRGVTLTCPHCGHSVFIRTSRLLTDTFREVWGNCAYCGFSGVANLSWERQLGPSVHPNPAVRLRIMGQQEAIDGFREALAANDEQLDLFTHDLTSCHPPDIQQTG